MRSSEHRRDARGGARPAGRARRETRAKTGRALGIEALEVRWTPAALAWSGLSTSTSNWSDSANWNPVAVPASGDSLSFPAGASRLTNTNNLTAGTEFVALGFSGSGYAITGNAIDLNGPISTTYASGTSEFDPPIALAPATTVSVADAGTTLIANGVLSGSALLTKAGAGTLSLGGADTYSGATTVFAGSLLVESSLASPTVAVQSGATLGGHGTVPSINSTGGTLLPGDGAASGELTVTGTTTFDANSSFVAHVSTTSSNQLVAGGQVTLNGARLDLNVDSTPLGGTSFTILRNTSGKAISGTFAGLAEGADVDVSGQTFQITYKGGTSGQDIVLTALKSTSTALTVSKSSPTYGESVTLTATVTGTGGGTPTGTVQFYNGTTALGSPQPVSNGTATLTTTLPVENAQITADYSGDASFASSTSPAQAVNVEKAPTTTTLVASPTTSTYGQPVTLKATVAPTTSGIGTPTGDVEFLNGSTEIETVPLVGGVATLTVPNSTTTTPLPVATNTLSAIYQSDDNFASSNSTSTSTVTVTVTGAPTTTALTLSPAQPTLGGAATLTATVTSTAGTPSGNVTFFDNGAILGTGTLSSSGVATLDTDQISGGANVLTATYDASGNFATSNSNSINVTLPQGSSTTSLAISPNPSTFGTAVTLTATVTGSGGGLLTPGGTVTFSSGSTTLGQGTLTSGIATLSTSSLPLGSDPVVATYAGSASFAGSASPAVAAQVNLAATRVTVTTNVANPGPSQTVTLTVTVASGLSGNTPTGTVQFYENGQPLGTAQALTSGTATITLSYIGVGNQNFTAAYSGDSNNAASTSASLILPVGTVLERYFEQVYLDVMGRSIDLDGLQTWISYFVRQGGLRPGVISRIVHSKEARQLGVQATYKNLVNTAPTSAQQQSAFVGQNGTALNLTSRVLGSSTYYVAAGRTNADFLAALGTDVLGTALPASLHASYSAELSRGVSRTTVARQLLASPLGKTAQVEGLYQRILNRMADAGGLKFYVNVLSQGHSTDQVLIARVDSDEFYADVAAATPTNVATTPTTSSSSSSSSTSGSTSTITASKA